MKLGNIGNLSKYFSVRHGNSEKSVRDYKFFTLLLFALILFSGAFLFTNTGIFTINAQENIQGFDSVKSNKKNVWEIVRQKRNGAPFLILTPQDLAGVSDEELQKFLGDPCDTAAPINFGQTVNGQLSNTDCRLDDGTYADFYTFTANQGQIVDIRLNSSAFDTYLGLANESGTFVVEDDDGGGGTNSRIVATLPRTGLYIILANSVFPDTFGAYTLSLNEIINCMYSISPTGATIPPEGGTFSLTITTQNGCQWTARTSSAGVTVNTPGGSGTGLIFYSVSQNGTGASRGGFLVINDSITFPIQQESLQCSISLSPTGVNIPQAGGSGTINVMIQPGCTWRVLGQSGNFITATGSGTGNGVINYTVAPNPGGDRSAKVLVGDALFSTFSVFQSGINCPLSISSNEIFAGFTGKTGTISVSSNCAWTAVSEDSFIQVTNSSGAGSGAFNFSVSANTTGSNRSGRIRVSNSQNNLTIFVNQIAQNSPTKFDFTRDGKADLMIFRPSTGDWWLNQNDQVFTRTNFGLAGDKLVPADYDGDSITEIVVWRPSNGVWYFNLTDGLTALQFGSQGDIPVPADYDGDGFADIAVFRPSNGVWYIRKSSDDQFIITQFGLAEDVPTVGDFDGDGKTDLAVWRPSTGVWYILNSSNGSFSAYQFGLSEDKPVAADYDGDGKTDVAVWRPSSRVWYILNSSNSTFSAVQFGLSDDLPIPADYDGDDKTDIAVYRPSDGVWYLLTSSEGLKVKPYGLSGDLPAQNAYIR